MKSYFLIAVLMSAASWAAAGRDLAEHVRFLADFDSPVQMGVMRTREDCREGDCVATCDMVFMLGPT